MWFRKVDRDAEIKGDNVEMIELLERLSQCVYIVLVGFSKIGKNRCLMLD